jgi:uncharacterized protein (TIGR00369 family)
VKESELEAKFQPEVAAALPGITASAPYSALLGLRVEEVKPGSIVCSLAVRDELQSGVGAIHGGAIASLVDHSLSLAVYPLVEPGKWVATSEFKINYLAAARTGTLRATARVLSLRRTVAVARVDVELDDGTLVAIAQGTLHVRDRA